MNELLQEKIVYIKKFYIRWCHREAEVIFADNKFDKCVFKVSNPVYDLQDWEFLKIVSSRIIELAIAAAGETPVSQGGTRLSVLNKIKGNP